MYNFFGVCKQHFAFYRVFNLPDETSSGTLKRRRLPESFFEPVEEDDSSFPDDLKLIVSSIRVFGHLEKSFFIEFCKFIETIHLSKGDYLFRIGDSDDSMYVVQTGVVQVYIKENVSFVRLDLPSIHVSFTLMLKDHW